MNEEFKLPTEVKSALLDDMARILGRISDGSLSDEQVVAEVKALAARLPAKPTKGRGRPIGAKTKAESSAVKRAREFLEFEYGGMKPTQAARAVVNNWKGVSESTVFKDVKRHQERLIDEIERGTDDIYCRAAQMFMEQYPGAADPLLEVYREMFDRLAIAVEKLGNPIAAEHVRSLEPHFAMIHVGEFFLSMIPDSTDPE